MEVPAFEKFDVIGVPIAAVSLDRAAEIISRWADSGEGHYVGVREVASTMAMAGSPDLLKVARKASMNVPDGMPLVWIGKWRNYDVSRTCGPDLMEHMLTRAPGRERRHFFYGGKPGVAERLKEVFTARTPGLQVVGTFSPPFGRPSPAQEAQTIETIRASGADVVWVGMSSPKQDQWMAAHADRLQMTLIGVGAAFDFHSGAVKRAPVWMQNFGLEWLHRLLKEPRRLWRRYFFLAPKFACRILTGEGG
jgi:N-acetylglucosaminyldiphosphoundecaprenol N-acetyl-beta-D-mannosaminyltransferase